MSRYKNPPVRMRFFLETIICAQAQSCSIAHCMCMLADQGREMVSRRSQFTDVEQCSAWLCCLSCSACCMSAALMTRVLQV